MMRCWPFEGEGLRVPSLAPQEDEARGAGSSHLRAPGGVPLGGVPLPVAEPG